MPIASVILPITERSSLTRQCLRALFATLPVNPEVEVLVAADPSVVTESILAMYGERIRLVNADPALGIAAGRNEGAMRARGDYLIFLDSDTEPQPGWLTALLAEACVHPKTALIGSRVLMLNDMIAHAGIMIGQDGFPVARYRGFPADHPAVMTSRLVTAVCTAGLLVRRDCFITAAGFDTSFTTWYTAVDLCLRLRELGAETWYCPTSTLYQYASPPFPAESATQDRALYHRRWGHRVPPNDVQQYLADGLLTLTYRSAYPIQIDVAPVLGVPEATRWESGIADLLDLRARQVADLLQKMTRMTVARTDESFPAREDPIETIAAMKLHTLLASRQELVFPTEARPRVSIVIPIYNQAQYLYLTLETLLATPGGVPFEVILVDDGSTDAVPQILERIGNVRVHTHGKHRGFGAACNHGASLAHGEFVCFLGSDVLPAPGWLDALTATMERYATCGAVGAKRILDDGTLQEAGGILWQDGTTLGYGRGGNPDAAEYSFAREVDYCSAACLLVRRKIFAAVGGFDPRYTTGYDEAVDLCLSIWRSGYSVRYTPQAVSLQLEHSGSVRARAGALQEGNRAALTEKWSNLSRDHGVPGLNLDRWRDRRSGARVLYIDDLIPVMRFGSGFPRTAALLDALSTAEYVVSFLPSTDSTRHEPMTRMLQERGVEVLYGSLDPLDSIAARPGYYDVAIVSRPHNAPLIGAIRAANPGVVIVYDAEALFALREARHSRAIGKPLTERELERRIRTELAEIGSADLVLAVSENERQAIVRYHPQIPVAVWSHAVEARASVPDFASRRGLAFLGYLASAPNDDAVLFLLRDIWPIVRAHCDIPLTIAGDGVSPAVRALAATSAQHVTIAGYVADLAAFFDQHRVFLAPHRFGAGIPLKVIEAMAHGVPCVVSPLLGDQLGITDGVEALIAADATDFATSIARLHEDATLWQNVQENARKFVRENYDPHRLHDALRERITALLMRDNWVAGIVGTETQSNP